MALADTLAFYKSLLLDAGFEIDDENQIHLTRFTANKENGWEVTRLPTTINSKGKSLPIVLPTKEEQKKAAGSNILYHPLSEQIDRGVSNTLEITRKQMEYVVQLRLVELLMVCGHILTTTSIQEKLSPTQAELLAQCPDFNQSSFKILVGLLTRRQQSDPLKRMITFCIKTAKKFKGEECKRVCSVVSPFYQACNGQQSEIWGLKNIPQKHSNAIARLVDFILPGFGDDEYSTGSDSSIAPQFDALVRVYGKLSHRLDKLDKLYSDYVTNVHPLKLTYEWEKSINQLGSLRNPIEPQEGNLGAKIAVKEALHRPEHEVKEMSMKEEDTPPWNPTPVTTSAPTRNTQTTSATSGTKTMIFDPTKRQQVQPTPAYTPPQPQYNPQPYQPPMQHAAPARVEGNKLVWSAPAQPGYYPPATPRGGRP